MATKRFKSTIDEFLRNLFNRSITLFQQALEFGELTKDVVVSRALPPPPPPPVPPTVLRHHVVLKEIERQPHVQPVIFTEFYNAQALIAPFPSFDYTLMDGAGDDHLLTDLQDHLRRRIDERPQHSLV